MSVVPPGQCPDALNPPWFMTEMLTDVYKMAVGAFWLVQEREKRVKVPSMAVGMGFFLGGICSPAGPSLQTSEV